MFAPIWLAVAGLPVFLQPFPAAPDAPAAIALIAGQVSLRRPCLALECPDAGWNSTTATTYAYRSGDRPTRREPLPGAPRSGIRRIRAPQRKPTEWWQAETRLDRLGARYGIRPIDTGHTGLEIELGTGYRFRPYADGGSGNTGMVARGRVELHTRLGERTRIAQHTRFETGRNSTVIRNSLGIEVQLMPHWSLHSDLETRRDTAARGRRSNGALRSSLKLKRVF